jgi:hypothetical protein
MVGNSVANPDSPHPAPDLLVRGTLRIRILLKGKNSKQNLDSYCFVTSLKMVQMYLQKEISREIY